MPTIKAKDLEQYRFDYMQRKQAEGDHQTHVNMVQIPASATLYAAPGQEHARPLDSIYKPPTPDDQSGFGDPDRWFLASEFHEVEGGVSISVRLRHWGSTYYLGFYVTPDTEIRVRTRVR